MDGESYEFIVHQWKSYTRSLYDQAEEGLVFNVNFREYKVNKILSFTYRVENGKAYDSTKKLIIPVALEDGCYDLAFMTDVSSKCKQRLDRVGVYNGEHVVLIKRRYDRVYPDSHQVISVARQKAVRYDKLMCYQIFREDGFVSPVPLAFRDSEQKDDYEVCPPLVQLFVGREETIDVEVKAKQTLIKFDSRDFIRDRDFCQDKVVGKDFSTSIQERTYFQNSVDRLIVSQIIVPKKKVKSYISWGDCFFSFYRYMLRYSVVCSGRKVYYSPEFDETSFFKFCVDRYLYLKDGMAYDLCLLKGLLNYGYVESVARKRLFISRARRKKGFCFSYRQFYVWYE